MSEKRRMLERLRARIVRELYLDKWHEVWFFPPFDGVEGWPGTQRIMFVGLNPSTGRFGGNADKRLYAQLKRKGFARAHLTDVIKERAVGRDVEKIERDPARMERYQRYLREEINIIGPRLIVAMGKRAYRILRDWLGVEPRLTPIPHYAARFPNAATARRFAAAMAKVRRDYITRGPKGAK